MPNTYLYLLQNVKQSQDLNSSHVTEPRPFGVNFFRGQNQDAVNLCAKFEVHSFTSSKDAEVVPQVINERNQLTIFGDRFKGDRFERRRRRFRIDTRSLAWELISFSSLSRRGLNPIKPVAYMTQISRMAGSI